MNLLQKLHDLLYLRKAVRLFGLAAVCNAVEDLYASDSESVYEYNKRLTVIRGGRA